jgi:hypothetical protein
MYVSRVVVASTCLELCYHYCVLSSIVVPLCPFIVMPFDVVAFLGLSFLVMPSLMVHCLPVSFILCAIIHSFGISYVSILCFSMHMSGVVLPSTCLEWCYHHCVLSCAIVKELFLHKTKLFQSSANPLICPKNP